MQALVCYLTQMSIEDAASAQVAGRIHGLDPLEWDFYAKLQRSLKALCVQRDIGFTLEHREQMVIIDHMGYFLAKVNDLAGEN
jgi:hypothetical protein